MCLRKRGLRWKAFVEECWFTAWGRFLEKKRRMWQVVATMVTFLAWAIFIVLFALVWAPSLSLFQNIVILIASFVAAIAIGAGSYAVGEAVKETAHAAAEEAVKEKIEERGIESERD